jgi:cephalosporin-C deacetylase-like acetyl esterase
MKTLVTALTVYLLAMGVPPLSAEELPGTQPLTRDGDIAAEMVGGIDKYLMRELDAAAKGGADQWHVNTADLKSYLESVKPNRERLAKILGVVDERIKPVTMTYLGEGVPSTLVAEGRGYKVYAVRWSVLPGVDGEGLLLEPNEKATASVVAIPDGDQTPEMLVGLAPGIRAESQFARAIAENRCRVIVPTLIDRKDTWSANPRIGRQTNLSHREFIWRMAYEMGRHILGYEIQKVLAAIDWLKAADPNLEVGVYGYGDGGVVALYAGALDPRMRATVASGLAYETRHLIWQEPIDRSVWGLLPTFRDEHLRHLFVGEKRWVNFEQAYPPKVDGPPKRAGYNQAAPGRLRLPEALVVEMEPLPYPHATRGHSAQYVGKGSDLEWNYTTVPKGIFGNPSVVGTFLNRLGVRDPKAPGGEPADLRQNFDPTPRQKRQFDQLVAFTQKLWRQSDLVRKQYWAKADASSPQKWEQSCEPYRNEFWEEIIGKLPKQTAPMNPKSRLTYDTPKWKGYEVTLDLYPDVFAYGILLLPKDLKPGEKRPVVVCQHGLEGRPQDVVNPNKVTPYYKSFGAQLADMGYIVYAPQNPYIGQEKFRVLLRKSHPLKLSLYAFIVRQHETATDWLASLPFVEADKIAFYGLSYGGKTAMRIPALVKRYCLSICAGDFNEWIGKNVSVDFPGSYMWTVEYDMYEFNLGHTFNYAEMANLIAPRPFMVERGHDDGVGIDEMIAWEYAKVRYLYANRLKIPGATAIEFRPGGHEIFLKGTAEFLKKHTGWPK